MLWVHSVCDSKQFPELSFGLLVPAQLSPASVCICFTAVLNIIFHSCLVIHHLFKTAFHPDPVLQIAGHLCCKDAEHKCVLYKSLESALDHGKALWDSLMD